MSGTTEILQEYLTKLGFVVDSVSHKKFTDALSLTEKKIFEIGSGVAGMVVSVEAGVAAFAFQMDKMYYASKLANNSVAGLMSVKYAGEQVGIAGEAMQSAIHGMAQALRLNPGLQGLIESFGIRVTGRDVSDVMLDFVRATKQMPEYVGEQYAAMFGMDADTYHLVMTQLDTIGDKQQANLEVMKNIGINAEHTAEVMHNYANALRDVENRAKLLGEVLATVAAPAFNVLAKETTHTFDYLAWGWNQILTGGKGPKNAPPRDASPSAEQPASPSSLFGSLEKKYNLPEGILDSMWLQESGRGQHMLSKKGAMGNFGFMPDTAKHYGLQDPNDLSQSATAAAKYMHDLLVRSHGDVSGALAGYNWGRVKTSGLPNETYNYIKSVMGRTRLGSGASVILHQNTNINVHGGATPEAVKSISREQSRINGNLIRDMHGWVMG